MKKNSAILSYSLLTMLLLICSCGRYVRTAEDITPGNSPQKLDWRYGAGDIRIQTSKVTSVLMDRWFAKTRGCSSPEKPRLIITEIDNRTDQYISTDMIRDIIESEAINDGRYTVVVGDFSDECELDDQMRKIICSGKYNNSSRLQSNMAIAPQFLGKVRITKAIRSDRFYDYEEYRMTITLYDIETGKAIDSAWDVLCKKVKRC